MYQHTLDCYHHYYCYHRALSRDCGVTHEVEGEYGTWSRLGGILWGWEVVNEAPPEVYSAREP